MASFAISDKKQNKQKKREHELIFKITVFVLHHIMKLDELSVNFPQIILMEDMVHFLEK